MTQHDTAALSTNRHNADDPALHAVLALIHKSFKAMEGRIDPPSSVHALDLAALQSEAETHEVWSLGDPPLACAIFRASDDALTIGKLAVAEAQRGQGLARQLIALAETRARDLGLSQLRLQTRIELVENHAVFQAMGFVEVARTAHNGYPAPTSITFARPILPRP